MRSLFNFFGLIALSVFAFSCKKETSRENDLVPVVIDAAWEFTEGATLYQGDIDTAYLGTEPGVQMLTLEGSSADGKNGSLMVQIIGELKTGSSFTSPSLYFQYSENGAVVFDNIPYDPNFSLTITKIDSVSISGTFTGVVLDAQGGQRTVTSGKFTAAIEGLSDDNEPEPEPELDYFPLQQSWTYEDGSQPIPQELTITAIGTEEINGTTYTVFENSRTGERKYYRTDGSNYYQYVTFDFGFPVQTPPELELLILKDDAEVGDSWDTEPFPVTIPGGPTASVMIRTSILSKDVPFNFNGVVYNDVFEVSTEIYSLNTSTNEFELNPGQGYTTLYARGVGIISFQDISDNSSWTITSYSKE